MLVDEEVLAMDRRRATYLPTAILAARLRLFLDEVRAQ